jgi:hypothetical protein
MRTPRLFSSSGPVDRSVSGAVSGAADSGWQRDQDDLAALAAHAQDPVAVLLTQVVDVGADGLEDPPTEQAEQAHGREVERVARLSGRSEHRLELEVRQPKRR